MLYKTNLRSRPLCNLHQRKLLLSDGTGETAERVLRSGLKQFDGYSAQVRKFPYITQVEQLQKIIQLTLEEDALLIFTLVDTSLRQEAKELAEQQRIRHIDLLDNVLSQLSLYFRASPIGVPNQMNLVNDEYFKRIEAIEFTVRGDDGKNPRMLSNADIILVGVSRTSKTPLSVFLAHKGYKVCNIPIVLDRPLPLHCLMWTKTASLHSPSIPMPYSRFVNSVWRL